MAINNTIDTKGMSNNNNNQYNEELDGLYDRSYDDDFSIEDESAEDKYVTINEK